jgi:hypothetical protein
MTTRSTELKHFIGACPGAVNHSRAGAVADRRIFAAGTAAHEFMEAAASGVEWGEVFDRLVTVGRVGRDAEPPLPERAVREGRDIALRWVELHGEPVGWPEVYLGVDSEMRPDTTAPLIGGPIDLVYMDEEGDPDGGDLVVVVGRDYKTSWRAGEDDLDSLQRRLHACLLWACYPDADAVRVEVAAMRTRKVHGRTLYRGTDDDQIAEWWAEIRHLSDLIEGAETLPYAPGAGCIGCMYAAHCPAAWSVVTDPDADPCTRWAVASGVAGACKPLAMEATREAPVAVPGGEVGHNARAGREVRPDAPDLLLSMWAPEGEPFGREQARSLLAAMKLGTTALEAAAKVKWTGRGCGDARRSWMETITTPVTASVWGVIKGGGE